jgi:hypothetical protein
MPRLFPARAFLSHSPAYGGGHGRAADEEKGCGGGRIGAGRTGRGEALRRAWGLGGRGPVPPHPRADPGGDVALGRSHRPGAMRHGRRRAGRHHPPGLRGTVREARPGAGVARGRSDADQPAHAGKSLRTAPGPGYRPGTCLAAAGHQGLRGPPRPGRRCRHGSGGPGMRTGTSTFSRRTISRTSKRAGPGRGPSCGHR